MRFVRRVLAKIQYLFRRSESIDRDLSDEFALHIELRAAEFTSSGMSEEEALRRARAEFGAVAATKDAVRDAIGLPWIEEVQQDVRYATRSFQRSPAFTIAVILTFALGIGSTTAIYAVVDGILLKPLPYPKPSQLVSLDLTPVGIDPSRRVMSPEAYMVFRDEQRAFHDIGIYAETDADNDAIVTGIAEPERVHAVYLSAGVLPALGVPPAVGRIFNSEDDQPSALATVVLSYTFWQRRFGGDQAAIGRTLLVDGIARQIIGVMPRDFSFLDTRNLMLMLPLQLERPRGFQGNFSYSGIGRLHSGVALADAAADMSRMLPIMYRTFPPGPGLPSHLFEKLRLVPSVMPLHAEVIGNVANLLWVLMGGVATVLLIACANVANLLLARTASREAELALRLAIGAKPLRIARQLITESVVLGSVGGVCGVGVAWAVLVLVVRLAPGLPRISAVTIDARAIVFALVAALTTSVVLGVFTILQHATVASRGVAASARVASLRRQQLAQGSLATAQVALAMVLLVGAGLMLRTFLTLTRVKPGYAPRNVQTFRLSFTQLDVPDAESVVRREQALMQQLSRIPGAGLVAFGSSVPMDGIKAPTDNLFVDDPVAARQPVPPPRRDMYVSPGYLRALGIALIAGREFDWTDTYNRAPVAVISEDLAREYWRDPAAALGKRIRAPWGTEWHQIVGVVTNVHSDGVEKPARSTVYWPVLTTGRDGIRATRFATFAVRAPLAGSRAFIADVQRAVRAVDPGTPFASVATLDQYYVRSMARTSVALSLLAAAAGMALILGAIGLYSVIAFSVSRRIREIGVRIALGASPQGVLALVLRRALALVFVGLALGAIAALVATRLLSSLVYGVRTVDPLTYIAVALLVGTVALLASYLPARRAAGVDPIVALRHS